MQRYRFLALLVVSMFWVLPPFLTSILWAVIVCIAMWPVLMRLGAVLAGQTVGRCQRS